MQDRYIYVNINKVLLWAHSALSEYGAIFWKNLKLGLISELNGD